MAVASNCFSRRLSRVYRSSSDDGQYGPVSGEQLISHWEALVNILLLQGLPAKVIYLTVMREAAMTVLILLSSVWKRRMTVFWIARLIAVADRLYRERDGEEW